MHRKSDFHYELPPERIAQRPADRRDASRLLVVKDHGLVDAGFPDVIEHIPADAVVVVNETRVIPARVRARKAETGGAVELLFVEPAGEGAWRCLGKSSKPIRAGARLAVGDAVLTVRERDGRELVVELDGDVESFLEAHGEPPLPPYIDRADGSEGADAERYQTVYARVPGAIAAPTAGLHMTHDLMTRLQARGCTIARLTLHVGLGTFTPVRVEDLDRHVMHRERYEIDEATAAAVNSGRPVVAVGTTAVRALESAADEAGNVRAGASDTALFIRPGYRFRVVDHLITNFHLPESTLLMLVTAFAGYERVMNAYRHAVASGYRFFSYGDAMFLTAA